MKIIKAETKYHIETGGNDEYGMDVGDVYKFDNEETMIEFLNGAYVESIHGSMSYYEYPINVYSKTEYTITYEDDNIEK